MHWHERAGRYIGTALKWLPLAAVVGALSGVLGAAFHGAIEVATAFRLAHSWTLYLLPVWTSAGSASPPAPPRRCCSTAAARR